MALQPNQRLRRGVVVVVRLVLVVVGFLFSVFYAVGPSWFGGLRHGIETTPAVSCPRCSCECLSESEWPSETFNQSSSDCSTGNPEMDEEKKKDIMSLLSEEIRLQKDVTRESLEHTQELVKDSRRASSHYQNEAEKCNLMVRNCEDAREMAEAALVEERKLTLQWEERARNFGWTDQEESSV